MKARFRIHPDVAWRIVDNVVFILTPDSRFHQSEDAVGQSIWEAISAAPPGEPTGEDELVQHLTSRFDVDAEMARADLKEYLEQLVQAGALQRVDRA